MPAQFNLSARLVLQGPFGVKPVVDKLNRSFKDVNVNVNVKVTRKSIKDINDITSAVNNLRASIRSLQTESKNVGAALSSNLSTKAIVPTVKAVENLNKAVKNTSTTSRRTNKSLSDTNAVIAATARGAAEAASQVEDFGRVSGLAIRRFAGFTISTTLVFGLFNAIVQATRGAIEFDRELNKIGQVTGRSAGGLRDLRDEVDRLSVSFGVSSDEILSAARTLSQAGFSANQVRSALEAIAKSDLAPTFESIEQTTEGAIAAIRQFNLEVEDLEGALGSINAVSKAFAVESSDIIAAIQRAGGVFAVTQEGIEDASTSLQQFSALFTSVRATTRESAETIAVALRTIFTRLQRRSTIDALRELNIELLDSQQNFVGGYEAVLRLSEGLKDLDPRNTRFTSIVEELGGVRQIGKLIPLIQRASVAQEAFKVAQEGEGSLTEDQIRAQEALANKIDRTRQSFAQLIRDLTNTEAFDSIARVGLFVVDTIIKITRSVKELLPILASAALIFGIKQVTSFTRGLVSTATGRGGEQGVVPQEDKTASIRAFAQRDKAAREANTTAQKSATQAIKENTAALKRTTLGDARNVTTTSGVRQARPLSADQIALNRRIQTEVRKFTAIMAKGGASQEQLDAGVKSLVRSIRGGATNIDASARAISTSFMTAGRMRSAGIAGTPINVGRGAGNIDALAERQLMRFGIPGTQFGASGPGRFETAQVRSVGLQGVRQEAATSRGVGLGVFGASGRDRTADIINRRAISAAEKEYVKQINKGVGEYRARSAALAAATVAEKRATQRIEKFAKGTGIQGSKLFQNIGSNTGQAALLAAPVISSAISASGGNSPLSQAVGSGVGGAALGGLIGGQATGGNPIGIILGAAVGGVSTFVITLSEATKELTRTQLSREVDSVARALVDLRKGVDNAGQTLERTLNNLDKRIRQRQSAVGQEAGAFGPSGAITATWNAFFDTAESIGRGRSVNTRTNMSNQLAMTQRGEELRESTVGADDQIISIFRDRLEKGLTGAELFKNLDRSRVESALGRQDVEASELTAFSTQGERERLANATGKVLAEEEIRRQASINKTVAAMREMNIEVNLMASRFDALARSAQLASSSGNSFRAQIEDINSGFAGIANLNLRDIAGNFDLISGGELGKRFELLRSATGNSQDVQNLEQVARDIQFLSTQGVELLSQAAAQGDISGDSAETLVNKIFEEGGFEGLAPITRKFFEKALNNIFGGRTGEDLNLSKLLEENPSFIQDLTGDLGRVTNEAVKNLSSTIESSANEYAASLSRIVNNQLQIASLQDQVIQVFNNSWDRRQELLGRDVSVAQVAQGRDDAVRRATTSAGIGATLDPTIIGAEIRRITSENQRLTERRQGSTDVKEITSLTSQISENNRRASELNKALNTLANDTRELATIERKIAEAESRRQAGRGFTSSLIGATLDPQQFRQLIQGVGGVAGIFGGGPITAEQFGAGEQLIQQISGLLKPEQARAFQDAAAEANLKRLEASGAPPELIKFLRGLDRRTEEQRLADQYKDVTDNQIKAIEEQQKILQQNTVALNNLSAALLKRTLEELGGDGSKIVDDVTKGAAGALERSLPKIFGPSGPPLRSGTPEGVVEPEEQRKKSDEFDPVEGFIDFVKEAHKRAAKEERENFLRERGIEPQREKTREEITEERDRFLRERGRGAPRGSSELDQRAEAAKAGALFADAIREFENERRKGNQNFTGGLINGGFSKSRQDNKRINVQGGEFVVNRLATRDNRELLEAINSGRVPGFVNGGIVGAGGRNAGGNANQAQLMGALTAFSSSATQLSQSLNNISVLSNNLNRLSEQLRNIAIPERIQIETAPMQVNVVFNGAEVLNNIKPEMAAMVEQHIKRALNKAINPVTGETNTRFV